jgi:hypothetical protein
MKFKSDSQRRACFANLNRFVKFSHLSKCDYFSNIFSCSNEFAKKKFYHGSAGFGGVVVGVEGLKPVAQQEMGPRSGGQMSDPDYIYLTSDKDVARSFAEREANYFKDKKYGPIVYEVAMEESYLEPDFEYPSSFKYKGLIPKEILKKVKFSHKRFTRPDYMKGDRRYVPVDVDLGKLNKAWKRNPDNYFEEEFVSSPERYEHVVDFIERGEKIDMPEVYAESDMDSINVADGRHRIAAMRDLGRKRMELLVPEFQRDYFEERFK